MIDVLKKFFAPTSKAEDKKDDESVLVATCALFLEIANIDGEFSESERDNILNILTKSHGLQKSHAEQIMIESAAELKRSIDSWKFAKMVNNSFSKEDKIRIVEQMWKLVMADGHLDQHEVYLTNKLAGLLHIDHKDFVAAKLKAFQ